MNKIKIDTVGAQLKKRLDNLKRIQHRKRYIPKRVIKRPNVTNTKNRVEHRQTTESRKLQFQHNKSITITIKSNKPISVYYNIDNSASMQLNKYRYIRVTDHEFTIADNLSNELYITIIRPNDTTYTFNYEYKESVQNKYAIIVGVSDYKYISDLSFCDEDASDWTNYLETLNYKCLVFGDREKRNYPHYDGIATEENVRNQIKKIASISNHNTKFAYITSGHGAGDNNGNSFLCMYDYTGLPTGKYTDKEFYNDMKQIKGQKFIFFDHCASGGMLDELKQLDDTFATSTCSDKGFGWDMSKYKNGAWTHCFLQKAIIEKYSHNEASLDQIFEYANTIFKSETGKTDTYDQPMKVSSRDNIYL